MPAVDGGIVFGILSVLVIVTALMVVTLKNIFHCALALILCLSGVAGIYILLEAEFLAAAQVLIYVGAVAILMIFAIMLTSHLSAAKIKQTNENAVSAALICLIFAACAMLLIGGTNVWRISEKTLPTDNIMMIGKYLMTQYMLPFEVVSVLLLAAMIGAIVLARKEES